MKFHDAIKCTIAMWTMGILLGWSLSGVAGQPVGIVKEKPSSGRSVKVVQGYMVPYEAVIPAGFIYSNEISKNPYHFTNQHLKKGLSIDSDIIRDN